MTNLWIPRLFLLALLPLVLMACATTPDHSQRFQEYEEAFRRQTPYVAHAVPRDGYQLHAREFNPTGKGPALILMHGFPDSLHLYGRLIPALGKDRHIVAYDALGWGASDKPMAHRYDVASLRSDLEAVVAYFELDNVVLVMHDASGQPAIDWALDNPSHTAGLILLNTYYGPMPDLRPPEAIDLFSTPGMRREITVWFATRSDSRWISGYTEQLEKFFSDPEPREIYLPLLSHQSLEIRPAFIGLNAVLREEVARRESQTPRLLSFEPPVRIIFGADDPYLNSEVGKAFGTLFPNSELFLIENAGHYVQLDQPGDVAALIRDFPNDVPRPQKTYAEGSAQP